MRRYAKAELNDSANYQSFAKRISPVPPRPVAEAGVEVWDSSPADSRGRLWAYILWLELRLSTTYDRLDDAFKDNARERAANERNHARWIESYKRLRAIRELADLVASPITGTDEAKADA